MRNEERKKDYLELLSDSKNTIANAVRAFRLFSEAEDRTGYDFCEMPLNIIQPVINKVTTSRSSSVNAIIFSLKNYVIWCEQRGIATSDAVFHIKIDPSNRISSEMPKDPAMMKAILDTVFDDPKHETVDIVYRAFFWFAYIGIYDTQAIDLNTDDVDIKNMTVTYQKKHYSIPEQAKEDILAAVEAEQFILYHDNPYYEKVQDRASGRAVLRTVRMRRPDLDNFRATISKKTKQSTFRLSYRKILLAGEYHRWYLAELQGEDTVELIRKFAENDYDYRETLLTNRDSFDAGTKRIKISAAVKQLDKDYNFWKVVYYA